MEEPTPATQVHGIVMPAGWIVFELWQDLMFHLWNCTLIQNPVLDGETRGCVTAMEQDTLHQALTVAIELAKQHKA